MTYVLDTNAFIVAGHYFPDRFPTFWIDLEGLVAGGRLVSVGEVRKELNNNSTTPHLMTWVEQHSDIFATPTLPELEFVKKIFEVPRFQDLIRRKDRLKGGPVADPFLIARAAVLGGTVVTQEADRTDAVRIPMVCKHFGVKVVNLEQLMTQENFKY